MKEAHRFVTLGVASVVMFVCLPVPNANAVAPSFMGLGSPPGSFLSHSEAVSPDGSVVVGAGNGGWRWNQQSGLVVMPGLWPVGVAQNGAFITGFTTGGTSQAFRWTPGGGTVLLGDLPGGGFQSEGMDITWDGSVIAGRSSSTAGVEGFRWTAATGMVGIGFCPGAENNVYTRAITPTGNVIVGGCEGPNANTDQAFRWTQATGMVGLGDLPGGEFSSEARDVSADGSVLVGRARSSLGNEAFRWTAATGMVGLGDLPGSSFGSEAYAVTADGNTIVGTGHASGSSAFIWDAQHGMRSIKDVLLVDYGLATPGWTLQEAWDISADGSVIVGHGTNPQGLTEAWRAVLPEPSALIPLVVAGLVMARRRQYP